MALPGEEVRSNLARFVERWRDYAGSERGEAQPFLDQLLECYGTDRQAAGARFEVHGGGGFMDMIWPGVCIVEMKRPSEAENLEAHREQAFEYWKQVQRDTGNAGRFVVVCAFRRFEIFEPGARWDVPVTTLELGDLPSRYEALDFLREREPRFVEDRADLTREAVALVTDLYNRVSDRRAAEPDTLRDFVLQCVWCMFAEDLGMIPERRFTKLIERLQDDPDSSSADDLGGLFRYLNRPGPRPEHGIYAGTPYADGGLFAVPSEVHLSREEIELVRQACTFDWKLVEPAIFGALLEGALGRERVWAFGAHYTSEADIRKVVEPTIVEPWTERIDACESLGDVQAAQEALANYVVLDPACGSGNFLYVAYRELRRIEARLRARERELRREAGLDQSGRTPAYPLTNLHGIELEPFAVKLARVTLWMAHKLAVEELGLDEPVLPLADLSGIRRADALKVEWPRADAIIGNPPYIGTKLIRSRLGNDYADWLEREFRIGLKDYAVYWFRKAHKLLENGGRGGLVVTNSIREGGNRQTALDYVVGNGGVIVNAVSSQSWSGAANVHVSVINWVKNPGQPPSRFVLDGADVEGVTSALRRGLDSDATSSLSANIGRQFFGVVPGGEGFLLSPEEAKEFLERTDARYRDVVRPFLIGSDISNDPAQAPTRYVIDFHFNALEEAMKYPAALERVRRLVKPHRDQVRRKAYREKWWRLEEPIVAMRRALELLSRYIACPAQGKRLPMTWCQPEWLPSNLTSVLAFEDDYSMGVLLSTIHGAWAIEQSTKLKSDPRYTTASFRTFPWPTQTLVHREAVSESSRAVIARRSEICVERQIGLTRLYNEVDDGAYRDLKALHAQLDEAVAAAYGWPKSAAHDTAESNRRLLELNQAIAEGRVSYEPFASGGGSR